LLELQAEEGMTEEVLDIDLFGRGSDGKSFQSTQGGARGRGAPTPATLGDDDDGFGFDFDPTASLSSSSSVGQFVAAAGIACGRTPHAEAISGEALWGGPQAAVRAPLARHHQWCF
jgi:hypothetical protein